ncbi:MAG: peptide chain release factor N(5)-glutamine methyltransferase [Candidatus Dojkabacteria bacterium]
MSENLKELYQIQEALKAAGYHDLSRISKEIQEYCHKKAIPPTLVLKRIETGEPWEYIQGEGEFYGNKFLLNSKTLIPRPETEKIVDVTISFLEGNDNYKNVIDVGTGSGCIIVSLAKVLKDKKGINFTGIDIDKGALKVAEENSLLHKVNEKVSFLKGNLLKGIEIKDGTLIIANLPYIPKKIYKQLDRSVVNFEPKRALLGGRDGLKYYRKLTSQAKKAQKKSVSLLMEIEPSTLENLQRVLDDYEIHVIKDYRDLDRFVLVNLS